MNGLANPGAQQHNNMSAAGDYDYHAAVIQSHWRGYSLRKSLRGLQLNDAQLQQQGVLQLGQGAHYEQEQQEQGCLQQQQQAHQMPVNSSWRQKLTASLPDVWNKAASMLIRRRGALQAKLTSR
jgi:hypothetical protein